jgi:glycosyltransferase involved in cell wall biosynthesis
MLDETSSVQIDLNKQGEVSQPRLVKIIYLITGLGVGGAERALVELATHLPKDRYEVVVACLQPPGPFSDDLMTSGIPVIDLGGMQGLDYVRSACRLFRLLRKEQAIILHSQLFRADVLAAVVGRFARVPIMVATRQNVNIGGMKKERVNRLIRHAFDRTIAVSDKVRTVEVQLSHTDPNKVVVIPNCVQVDSFTNINEKKVKALRTELGLDSDTPLIGIVARFHKQKGHIYLLEAMTQVLKEVPTFKALLVGDGELRSAIEEKARMLNLSNDVIFTGIRHDISEILALIDLFVLPSLWEGLPLSLLEAMAAGKPVIATPVGGVPEIIEDGINGLLVSPRSPNDLAEAIITLLQNPKKAKSMGDAGRKKVDEYSVEAMVQKTENLYRQLIQENLGLEYKSNQWQKM